MRVLGLGVLVLLLLATGYNGLVEGVSATHYADTGGMQVATVTQLLYGVLSVAALLALGFRRRRVHGLLVGWAIALTATMALAPVVYGGQSLWKGVLAGSVTALIAGLAVRGWKLVSRS
ncbi:MAG TPA: hypothetical protein VGP61_05050 [Gemmatimonadales bacterium]|nr:hypothetical protein [Gemmatimonadales bacterium]